MKANPTDSIAGTGVIRALEDRFRECTGTRFAIALCNATAAIHAALVSIDVGRGDEVIVPSYTWGGSITGVLQVGATPVFADIDHSLTLDPRDVAAKITAKTRAVILVHLFGHPGQTVQLQAICKNANIKLIEDCAQAFGSLQNGRSVGGVGIGCFSFSPGKSLSAGDGGMLTTDDPEIYQGVLFRTQHTLRQLTDINGPAIANPFSLNYRMSSYTADRVLRRFEISRRRVRDRSIKFGQLNDLLSNQFESLKPIKIRPGTEPSWHRFSPEVDREIFEKEFPEIQDFLATNDLFIEKGYVSRPLHREPALATYLPLRTLRSLSRQHLVHTERACVTRIGISSGAAQVK